MGTLAKMSLAVAMSRGKLHYDPWGSVEFDGQRLSTERSVNYRFDSETYGLPEAIRTTRINAWTTVHRFLILRAFPIHKVNPVFLTDLI